MTRSQLLRLGAGDNTSRDIMTLSDEVVFTSSFVRRLARAVPCVFIDGSTIMTTRSKALRKMLFYYGIHVDSSSVNGVYTFLKCSHKIDKSLVVFYDPVERTFTQTLRTGITHAFYNGSNCTRALFGVSSLTDEIICKVKSVFYSSTSYLKKIVKSIVSQSRTSKLYGAVIADGKMECPTVCHGLSSGNSGVTAVLTERTNPVSTAESVQDKDGLGSATKRSSAETGNVNRIPACPPNKQELDMPCYSKVPPPSDYSSLYMRSRVLDPRVWNAICCHLLYSRGKHIPRAPYDPIFCQLYLQSNGFPTAVSELESILKKIILERNVPVSLSSIRMSATEAVLNTVLRSWT